MLLLDTHAWIDYFSSETRKEQIKEIISEKALFTSMLSLAEVKLWLLKKGLNEEKYLMFIEENSRLISPDKEISLLAGRIKFDAVKKDFGMIDCLIYATALKFDLKVVTGDPHFEGLENAIYLK